MARRVSADRAPPNARRAPAAAPPAGCTATALSSRAAYTSLLIEHLRSGRLPVYSLLQVANPPARPPPGGPGAREVLTCLDRGGTMRGLYIVALLRLGVLHEHGS